jgi:cyanophycinase
MSDKLLRLFLLLLAVVLTLHDASTAQSYQYFRLGQKNDLQTTTSAGIAMMGGGKDLDDAFRWLCAKANGGDFLILRARGDDDYNPYVNGLCKLNSVATLIIPDRHAASNPAVSDIIRHAEAIFIAGGDQSRYVNFWKTTPVQDAIDEAVAAGKPLGGTSAGLAILGQYSYGALNDPDDGELGSKEALSNPYVAQVTVVRDFLNLPLLKNTLTDSHFAKRDRMGRSLVFLARIMVAGWSNAPREVAIDEKSAVLVESDGKATVVGSGKGAYFIRPTQNPEVCKRDQALTFGNISVYKDPTGSHFDLSSWTGEGGVSYILNVNQGVIHSDQPDHSVY